MLIESCKFNQRQNYSLAPETTTPSVIKNAINVSCIASEISFYWLSS